MTEADAGSPDVDIQRDAVVAVHDGVQLLADLYRPATEGPHPSVVLLHGGGWKGETKVRSWEHWGTYLARAGFAALAASYRLSSDREAVGLRSVDDVRAAVQWLRGRAADLGVDPRRVGVLGDSAGGHLAALLTLTGREPGRKSAYPDDEFAALPGSVDVAVPVYGIFDMIAQWEFDQVVRPEDSITEVFLGGTPMSRRQAYYAASPLYHASAANARGTAWLLIHGTADTVVDHRQSQVMATHLQRAGATVRNLEVGGAAHFWFRETPIEDPMPGNPTAFVAPRILAFLRRHL